MSISKVSLKRGQASLEMVVGLIILLVVAGVVIGLVLTTMNQDNIKNVGAGNAARTYLADCNSLCETKSYSKYCTVTFKDQSKGVIDWDGDKQEGRLVKDSNFVWDFCEDSVYCFLVTQCDSMDMDGCRAYMCQEYMNKYKDPAKATEKLKELYKYRDASVSSKEDTCYREAKKGGPKQYFSDLAPEDNWIQAGFATKSWCGGGTLSTADCGDGVCDCLGGETVSNCPRDCKYVCGNGNCEKTYGECERNCPSDCSAMVAISLSGCIYNSTAGNVVCTTNCVGGVADSSRFVVIEPSGNDSKYSLAMEKPLVTAAGTFNFGNLTFAGGNMIAVPAHVDLSGFAYYSLAEMGQDTSKWTASILCNSPKGTGTASGVTKV